VPVRYDADRTYRECAKSIPSPLPSPVWSETLDAESPVKLGEASSASSKPRARRDLGDPSAQSWAGRDGFRLWDDDDEGGGGASGKDARERERARERESTDTLAQLHLTHAAARGRVAASASSPVVARTVAGIVHASGASPDRQNAKGPGGSSPKLRRRPHRHGAKSPLRSMCRLVSPNGGREERGGGRWGQSPGCHGAKSPLRSMSPVRRLNRPSAASHDAAADVQHGGHRRHYDPPAPVRRRGATAPCTSQSPARKCPPFHPTPYTLHPTP